MARKKISYNPFKMWGSYVGSFVFLFTGFFAPKNILTSYISEVLRFYLNVPEVFPSLALALPFIIIAFLIHILMGFLIGWGIHSSIKRLRK